MSRQLQDGESHSLTIYKLFVGKVRCCKQAGSPRKAKSLKRLRIVGKQGNGYPEEEERKGYRKHLYNRDGDSR